MDVQSPSRKRKHNGDGKNVKLNPPSNSKEGTQEKLSSNQNNNNSGRPNQAILDSFYGLPNVRPIKRCASVKTILSKLAVNKSDKTGFSYVVERLIKGTGSPRLAARLGNATALAEVLAVHPAFQFEDIKGLMDKHLLISDKNADVSTSGQIISQTLCIMAVWKSGKCSVTELKSLATQLVELRREFSKLSFFLTKCVVECAKILSADQFTEVFKNLLSADFRIKSLENLESDRLWLALELAKQFPEEVRIPLDFKSLNDSQLEQIATMLKSSCRGSSMHPVWILFFNKISGSRIFTKFWEEVIIAHFLRSEKPELVLVGLKLTEIAFSDKLPENELNVLLSGTFLKTILDALLNWQTSKFTRPVCSSLMSKFSEWLTANEAFSDEFMLNLLRRIWKASSRFDQLTKTKLAETVVVHLSQTAAMIYLKEIQQSLENPKSVDGTELVGQLLHMQYIFLKQSSGVEIRETILTNLSTWLCSSKELSPKTGEWVLRTCTSVLNTCLQSLCIVALKPGHKKVELPLESAKILRRLGSKLFKIVDLGKGQKTVKQGLKVTEKLMETGSIVEKGFLTLILYSILWCLLGKEEVDDNCATLKELLLCLEHQKDEGKDAEEEHSWKEVVIDLLLGLCSQKMYKNIKPVIHVAIHCFSQSLTFENLKPILAALKGTDESLFTQEDDDSDLSSMEVEEESEDSEGEEEDSKGGEGQENVDPNLIDSLKKALGDAAAESDQESVKSDFSDDTMIRLDEGLAAAFKSHVHHSTVGRKKREKETKEQRKVFQMRCFDLLLVYLNSDHRLTATTQMIVPLLEVAEEAAKNQSLEIFERAKTLVLMIASAKPADKVADDEDVLKALRGVFEFSAKLLPPDVQVLAGEAIRFLMKVAENAGQECEGASKEVFVEKLASFMTDRTCIISEASFRIIFTKNPENLLDCLPRLGTYAFSEDVRVYRKTEACTWCLNFCAKNLFPEGEKRKKPWKKFIKHVRHGITQVISEAVEGANVETGASESSSVNPRYLASVILLLRAIAGAKAHLVLEKLKKDEVLIESLKKLTSNNRWRKQPFVKSARMIVVSKKSPNAVIKGILRDLGADGTIPKDAE